MGSSVCSGRSRTAWRLDGPSLAKQAFVGLDGEGARLYGGRWNSPGRPMVYTAANPSLVALEMLVHLDLPPELAPSDYRLLSIRVPDDAPSQIL